jgi:DnaJ-class molecular chaperone
MFRDINEAQDVLTNPEKRKMYDSGEMTFDGDTGADFSDFGNMSGFNKMSDFGGNGQTFKFTFNGQEMGGMGGGGMDPSKIFEMFMGGGIGAFGNPFGQRRKST